MQLIDVAPDHRRQTPTRATRTQRDPKARIRLVIESLFSNLKRQMRLDDHLAKTTPGLAQKFVQRLLVGHSACSSTSNSAAPMRTRRLRRMMNLDQAACAVRRPADLEGRDASAGDDKTHEQEVGDQADERSRRKSRLQRRRRG